MTKRVKLTEKQVRKAINEISYGAVSDARDINYDLFSDIFHSFGPFYERLEDLERAMNDFQRDLYQNKNFNIYRQSSNNQYLNKINSLTIQIEKNMSEIVNASNQINNILTRKDKQLDNFEDAILKADSNPNNDWTEDNRNMPIRDLQNV